MTNPGQVLVLGLGNIILQDEGLGVWALERLQARHQFADHVRLMDGGTLGLDLLPYLAEAANVLLLDAVDSGKSPGALARLEGDAVPAQLALKLSAHQIGLQELLAAARFQGVWPRRLVLWGMQPAVLDWGAEPSALVQAALDSLVEAAAGELRAWGALR